MAQFGAPNFLQAIDAYEMGSRRAERNRLAELDQLGRQLQGQALQGDQNALARLGEVNPQAYMQTKQFSAQEKAARLDELAAGAMAADTPEKWAAFVQKAAAQGHRLDPGETRESILDQAMGWKEKLAQSNEDRRFNASQSNAARSYDLQLRGFKADENYRRQQLDLEKQKLNQPDLTSDIKEYNYAVSQGFKGSYMDFKNALKNNSELSVTLADGTVISQGPGKPPNEGQSKDIGFLTRMTGAMDSLDKNEGALLSLGENVGGRAPIVGNYMKSPQYQQAEQAGSEFLTGLLRKDSGGAITPAEEVFYGGMYLPKPGDGKEVLAQKREARKRAALGIKMGLPAHLIANMEKSGVDFTKLAPGPDGNKGDMGGAPRVRTYNPATGELE